MRIVSPFVFSALLLVACDGKPVVERRFGKKEKSEKETSVLQAADITGYDGTKLRRSAGALRDANKKRNQAIRNALNNSE
jgi:hypothetical protein